MIAEVIGEIGLLNSVEMESFPDLFLALQAEGKAHPADSTTLDKCESTLAPWRAKAEQEKQDAGGFLIKVVLLPASVVPRELN